MDIINTMETIVDRTFRVGSRNSPLALYQANEVIAWLVEASNKKGIALTEKNFEIVEVSTASGDLNLKSELYKMQGIGVFCKKLEQEILADACDIGVHSMKDLPTDVTEGLEVVAIPELRPREDIVIFNSKHAGITSLADLPEGSIIGSSSLRRIHTLNQLYGQKYKIENIRGNLNTRLKKLEESFDAIILAKAGVQRLGWEDKIGETLSKSEFAYAPAQGSLAVQCRTADSDVVELLKLIDDPVARAMVSAERLFMRMLEGGCTMPISVNSSIRTEGSEWSDFFTSESIDNIQYSLVGKVYDQDNLGKWKEGKVEGNLSDWKQLAEDLVGQIKAQEF